MPIAVHTQHPVPQHPYVGVGEAELVSGPLIHGELLQVVGHLEDAGGLEHMDEACDRMACV